MDSHLSARDPQLVLNIVNHLKSQGFFDQFRRECLADVDTKPSFQNLRQRVEGYVSKFLSQQNWKPELNKNMLRDSLRKQINDSGMLSIGVDHVVDQVVNPKISRSFLPQIETIVRQYLGLEHPSESAPVNEKSEDQKENIKKESILSPDPIVRDAGPKTFGKPENFEKTPEVVDLPDTLKKESDKEGPLPLGTTGEKTLSTPTTGKLVEASVSTDTNVDSKSNDLVVACMNDSAHKIEGLFSNIHQSTDKSIKSPISQDNTSPEFDKLDGIGKDLVEAPGEMKIKEDIQKQIVADATNERTNIFVFDDNSVSCADSNDGEKLIINEDSVMSDVIMESEGNDSREQSNSRPEIKQEISSSSDKEFNVKATVEETRTDFQNIQEKDGTLGGQAKEKTEIKKEGGDNKDGKAKKDFHRKYDKDKSPSKYKHSEQSRSKHSSSKTDPKHKSSSKSKDSEKHKHESSSKTSSKTESKTPKSHSDHKSKSSSVKPEHKHKSSHSSSKTVEKTSKPSESSSSKFLSNSKSDKHDSEKKHKLTKEETSNSKKKSVSNDSKDHKPKSSTGSHSGSKSSKVLEEKSKKLATPSDNKTSDKSKSSESKSKVADSSKHSERSKSSDKTKYKDSTLSKSDKKGDSTSSSKDRSKSSKHEERKISHSDSKKEGTGNSQDVQEKTSGSENSNSGDSCNKGMVKNRESYEETSPKPGLEKMISDSAFSAENISAKPKSEDGLNTDKERISPENAEETSKKTENTETMKCDLVESCTIDNSKEGFDSTKRETIASTPTDKLSGDASEVTQSLLNNELPETIPETSVSKSLNDDSSELKQEVSGLSNDGISGSCKKLDTLTEESSDSVCIIEIGSGDNNNTNSKPESYSLVDEKDESRKFKDIESVKSDIKSSEIAEVTEKGDNTNKMDLLAASDDDDKTKDTKRNISEVHSSGSEDSKEDLMKSLVLQKSKNESGSILDQLGSSAVSDSKRGEDKDNKSESISSVHTSDLSDYEDQISLSSSDELEAVESVKPEVKEKKLPLKEIKEVAATYLKSRTNSSGRSTPILPSGDDDTNQSAFKQRLDKPKTEADSSNKPEAGTNAEERQQSDDDEGVRTSSRFGRQRKANPKYASEEYIVDSSWKDSDLAPVPIASARRSTRKSVDEVAKSTPKALASNTPESVPSPSLPLKMTGRKRRWSKASDKTSEEGVEKVSENEKRKDSKNAEVEKKIERRSTDMVQEKYRKKEKTTTNKSDEKKRRGEKKADSGKESETNEKKGTDKKLENEKKTEKRSIERNDKKNEKRSIEKTPEIEKINEKNSETEKKPPDNERKGEKKGTERSLVTDERSSSAEGRGTLEEVQTRSRRKTGSSASPEAGKHRTESQRYDSSDLYKPRPVIGSRRHRTNEEAANTEPTQEKSSPDQTKKPRGRPRKRPATPPPKPAPFVKRKR